MAAKKQSRRGRRSSSGASSGHDEMPGGEMGEPTTVGLTNMPLEGEAHGFAMASGQAGSPAVSTGLMPGEEVAMGAGAADGEMPGGGMSST